MGVTARIFLASILLKEMRYLVYIRYLWLGQAEVYSSTSYSTAYLDPVSSECVERNWLFQVKSVIQVESDDEEEAMDICDDNGSTCSDDSVEIEVEDDDDDIILEEIPIRKTIKDLSE
jgi:hypothetical protein